MLARSSPFIINDSQQVKQATQFSELAPYKALKYVKESLV